MAAGRAAPQKCKKKWPSARVRDEGLGPAKAGLFAVSVAPWPLKAGVTKSARSSPRTHRPSGFRQRSFRSQKLRSSCLSCPQLAEARFFFAPNSSTIAPRAFFPWRENLAGVTGKPRPSPEERNLCILLGTGRQHQMDHEAILKARAQPIRPRPRCVSFREWHKWLLGPDCVSSIPKLAPRTPNRERNQGAAAFIQVQCNRGSGHARIG